MTRRPGRVASHAQITRATRACRALPCLALPTRDALPIFLVRLYLRLADLLGCDALDCCYEEQSGNHVEYQIPNVHPGFLAPVTHKGKETVNLFNSTSISADAYQWKFAIEKFTAYTVGSTLVRWNVNANGVNFTNDYANYTAVPESEVRRSISHAISCPSEHDHHSIISFSTPPAPLHVPLTRAPTAVGVRAARGLPGDVQRAGAMPGLSNLQVRRAGLR